MRNQKKYKAFTLLELVISIIILGIVLAAFPAFFQTSLNSTKQYIKEEIFFEEFTLLSLVTSRYFDENSTKGDNFYKDLNASNGDSDVNKVAGELYNNYKSQYAGDTSRIGKSQINNNVYRSGSKDNVSVIRIDDENSSDVNTYDDIDDFNDYNETFLGKYKIFVYVKYINDDANYSDTNINFEYNYSSETNFTNLKLITIKTTVDGNDIILCYPAANIGASKFLSLEELSR